MTVFIIVLTLWTGGVHERAFGRDYATEADCLHARHTMDVRQGILECKPAKVQGS